MLSSTGKKVTMTTTAAFDSQVTPNARPSTGASPTIGTAPNAAASGKNPRCKKVLPATPIRLPDNPGKKTDHKPQQDFFDKRHISVADEHREVLPQRDPNVGHAREDTFGDTETDDQTLPEQQEHERDRRR